MVSCGPEPEPNLWSSADSVLRVESRGNHLSAQVLRIIILGNFVVVCNSASSNLLAIKRYFCSNSCGTELLARNISLHIRVILMNSVNVQVARSQSASYPKWVAEFNTEMWATQNSKLCLDRGFCLPVGGQSPWATLGPLDASKEVVMVVADLDTSAFFHGNAKGAVSSASGVAALLGAFIALGQVCSCVRAVRLQGIRFRTNRLRRGSTRSCLHSSKARLGVTLGRNDS